MRRIILLCLSLSLIAFFIVSIADAKDNSKIDIVEYVTVTVEEGDTIWSLAKPYFNGKSDYREFIYQIKEINSVEQGIIYPGQFIQIPLL